MHTPSSSYMNASDLDLPRDHPFRAALPPRLHISADGDIVSVHTARRSRRLAAVVDGTTLSPLNTEPETLTVRPTSVLSVSSTNSSASTTTCASTASATSTTSNVSRTSDGSTSKLVRTLGSDLICNLSPETLHSTAASHCPSPREVIKTILSKKLRSGTS